MTEQGESHKLRNDRWKNSPGSRLLECPDCGRELSGLPTDRLFFCRKCKLGIDIKTAPNSDTIPVTFAQVNTNISETTIFLPVWQFKLNIILKSSVPKAEECLPDSIWIFGFVLKRLHIYGNAYVEFNKMQHTMMFDGKAREIIGAEVNEDQAVRLVEPVFLSLALKNEAFDQLELDIDVSESSLRAIPFYVRPDRLLFPGSDFSINRALTGFNRELDDLLAVSG
jgi:hypothetical protein